MRDLTNYSESISLKIRPSLLKRVIYSIEFKTNLLSHIGYNIARTSNPVYIFNMIIHESNAYNSQEKSRWFSLGLSSGCQ